MHLKKTVTAAIVLAAFASPSIAMDLGFLNEAPITRLNADEVTKLRAFVSESLDTVADGASAQWSAPKTPFKGTLTIRKSVNDGKYRCRQARIESASTDRQHAGEYWFCKTQGSDWVYRTPGDPKPVAK